MRLWRREQESGLRDTHMETDAFAPLKLLREWSIVQENPGVVKLAVKPVLHLAHDPQGVVYLPVAREHEERRVFTSGQWRHVWLRGWVGLDRMRRWVGLDRMRRGLGLDRSFFGGVMEYWGCHVRRAFI